MKSAGRYELKYILDERQYTDVLSWLNTLLPSRRSYPGRFVNSIYFDDPEFTAVKDNLIGHPYRQKLRLRWYESQLNGISKPKLELKARDGRLGNKLNFALENFPVKINHMLFSEFTGLIKKSIPDQGIRENIFSKHLCPSLYVRYYRDYFEAPFNLRITIDSALTYILPNFSRSVSNSLNIRYPHRIMEVKFPPLEKNSIRNQLRNLNLSPRRHSKYLMGLSMHGQVTYV